MAQTYVKGTLYQISIIDFKPDPNQPRKVVDPVALAELAASIRQHGILQPLLFRVAEGSPYLLIVSGERRFLAAKQAGLLILPAMCVEGNYAEIALVENLQRQDITSVEEAEAFKRLMVEQNYTQEQLGDMVGKARTTVSDILTINRLPQAIRDECRGDRQITRQTLIAIARKKQERGMVTAYNTYRIKQQKVKGSRQQKDPNDHATSLEIAQKTGMKIDNLDTVAWTDDEREIYRVTLEDLKNKIDRFINKPSTMLA
ncbi:MAG: ParB/RepB/Spo0J family partition protein [Syntrophales bacterium]